MTTTFMIMTILTMMTIVTWQQHRPMRGGHHHVMGPRGAPRPQRSNDICRCVEDEEEEEDDAGDNDDDDDDSVDDDWVRPSVQDAADLPLPPPQPSK
jgi:hypothetical protein